MLIERGFVAVKVNGYDKLRIDKALWDELVAKDDVVEEDLEVVEEDLEFVEEDEDIRDGDEVIDFCCDCGDIGALAAWKQFCEQKYKCKFVDF